MEQQPNTLSPYKHHYVLPEKYNVMELVIFVPTYLEHDRSHLISHPILYTVSHFSRFTIEVLLYYMTKKPKIFNN